MRQRVAALLVVVAAWSWLLWPWHMGQDGAVVDGGMAAVTAANVSRDPDAASSGRKSVAAEASAGVRFEAPAVPAEEVRVPVSLRVLDDDTGRDVKDAQIVEVAGPRGASHPGDVGPADVVVECAASPMHFEARGGSRRYYVRAPAFAWERFNLPQPGSERVVRLVPGGDLEVTLTGNHPPQEARLRLWEAEASTPMDASTPPPVFSSMPDAELAPPPSGVTRINGLHTGTCLVALEVGPVSRQPVRLGWTSVRITADGIARAVIAVHDVPRTRLVPVAGTLRLGDAWRGEASIHITAIGGQRDKEETSKNVDVRAMRLLGVGEYGFDLGSMLSGSYMVLVLPCRYRTSFEIGSDGATDVCIDVPAPADVTVHVLDSQSGNAVAGAELSWAWTTVIGETGTDFARLQADPDGAFRFQVAVGTVALSVFPPGYCQCGVTQVVHSGSNDFVLSLLPGCGVDLVFSGDEAPQWNEDCMVTLVNGTTITRARAVSGNRYQAFGPGEYRVVLGGLRDFEQVRPPTVVLTAGSWTRVDIELRRKR
jgi:hypothetical protein